MKISLLALHPLQLCAWRLFCQVLSLQVFSCNVPFLWSVDDVIGIIAQVDLLITRKASDAFKPVWAVIIQLVDTFNPILV